MDSKPLPLCPAKYFHPNDGRIHSYATLSRTRGHRPVTPILGTQEGGGFEFKANWTTKTGYVV